jgi:hypothetical protein
MVLVTTAFSTTKSRDRARRVVMNVTEKSGESMRMLMRVQNSGTNVTTSLQKEQTEVRANGSTPDALHCSYTSLKITTSNSTGRDAIVVFLRPLLVCAVNEVGVRRLGEPGNVFGRAPRAQSGIPIESLP